MQTLPPYPPSPQLPDVATQTKGILKVLLSPELQKVLFPLKVVFILVTGVLLIGGLYLMIKTNYMEWEFLENWKNFLLPRIFKRISLIRKWKKIKGYLKKENWQDWRYAISESVIFLDKILEEKGYKGESLEEKVEQLTSEDVKEIIKFKNAIRISQDIIRDPDYRIEKEAARGIIEVFEKALKDLEIF